MAKTTPKKAAKKSTPKAPTRKLSLPNDEPLRLDMTFEQAIKWAVNTPVKKKNKNG